MEHLINDIFSFSTDFMGTGALLIASFTSLFSVVNPLAAMPVFLTLVEDHPLEDQIRTARKSAIYMFLVLATFSIFRDFHSFIFGISLPGIMIAGGFVIMRAGFSMMNPETGGRKLSKKDQEAAMTKEDVSFSPIAMPLLAGPGSIAVVIGFGSQANSIDDYIINTIAVFLCACVAWGIIRVAPWLTTVIGRSGMIVITRMMGFIALSIGVQFVINGISSFFGLNG